MCNQSCDLVIKTDSDLPARLGTAFIPANSTYVLDFTAPALIAGDLNQDGTINSSDAAIITTKYGQTGLTDLNNDKTTDEKDLQILIENYGKTF
jgi:hypothetical protein